MYVFDIVYKGRYPGEYAWGMAVGCAARGLTPAALQGGYLLLVSFVFDRRQMASHSLRVRR